MSRLLSLAAGVHPTLPPADMVTAAAGAGWPACGIWFDGATWTSATTKEVKKRLDDTGVIALDMEPIIPADGADDYAEQASAIASQGSADTKIADDDQWRSLGVFAVARSEDASPSTFMSLAIDRAGLLRGTYYDAVSDTSMNITGKVDKKTQRAAWIVGDKKTIVYEAGLHNLTQQQTTILVHRSTDARRAKSPDGSIAAGDPAASTVEQLLLVRVEDDAAAGSGQKVDSTQAASPMTKTPIAEDSGK